VSYKLLYYGPPGSGKTTAACLYSPPPVLLLDIEGKVSRMEVLQPLITDGRVIVQNLNFPLTQERVRIRMLAASDGHGKAEKVGVLQSMPQGYNKIVSALNAILENAPGVPKHQTLVIDSMTRVLEHIKRLICYTNKRPTLVEQDWGILLSNLEEFVGAFLPIEQNVILIAHQRYERDDMTGAIIATEPLIDGQMRSKICAYFDEAWHFEPLFVGNASQNRYLVRTSATSTVTARTSRLMDSVLDIRDATYHIWPELREQGSEKK